MPLRLIKVPILLVGLAPTLFSLFAAGILLGRPRVCDKGVCVPYGAEVLLLPIGTGVPLLCGYLLGLGGTSPKQKQSLRREHNFKDTNQPETVSLKGRGE